MSLSNISSSSSSFSATKSEPEKKGQSPAAEKAGNIGVIALAAPEVQHEPKFMDMEVSHSEENEQSATTEKSNSVAVSTISQQELQDDPMEVDLSQPEEQLPPPTVITSGDPAHDELHMQDVQKPILPPPPPPQVREADCVLMARHEISFPDLATPFQINGHVIDVENLKPILTTIKNTFHQELPKLLACDSQLFVLRPKRNQGTQIQNKEIQNKEIQNKEIQNEEIQNEIFNIETFMIGTLIKTDEIVKHWSFVALGSRISNPLRCVTWFTSAHADGEIVIPPYFTCELQGKMHVMMYNVQENFQLHNCHLKVVVDNFLVEIKFDDTDFPRPLGIIVVAIPVIENQKAIGVNLYLFADNTVNYIKKE